MTSEMHGPIEADGTPPQSVGAEQPPLSLKESVDRSRMFAELLALMHNVMTVRWPEASPEEREIIKARFDSSTREMLLPKIPDLSPHQQTADRETEQRKQIQAREALKRLPPL